MELMKITKYLDKKFNPKLAAEWDFTGFQFLNKKQRLDIDIKKILVCLDVDKSVVDYAIKNKFNLIISRHPFIFGDLQKEILNPAKNEMINNLVKNNILIYSIHTNYDSSPSQKLTTLFEKDFNIKNVFKFGIYNEGFRFKLKSKISLKELKNNVEKIFNIDDVYVNKNWNDSLQINEFIIATGSGGSTMVETNLESQTFITGEVKWNEWIYASDNNVNLLCIGHYMENYFITDLTDKLLNVFKDLEVIKFDIGNKYKRG